MKTYTITRKQSPEYVKLYKVWSSMKSRCYRQKDVSYKNYGGRGIKVKSEWEQNFPQFYKDMFPTYKKGLSLDRIDVNKDYGKQNCKWSSNSEQQQNKVRKNSKVVYKYEGNLLTLANRHNLKYRTVQSRLLRGATMEEALKPLQRIRYENR